MDQAAALFLEQGGLLGAVIVVLAGVVIYQNNKNEKLRAENTGLHREINAINERWRDSEMKRSDRATDALNASTAVQAAWTEKVKLGRRIE